MDTPKTLTTEESNKLIYAIHKEHNTQMQARRAKRNTCIALLMLDAGLRVGEVSQLKKAALIMLDEAVKTIYLPASITKTKQDRAVPTTERLRESIKELNNDCWQYSSTGGEGWAFWSNNSSIPITTRQIERVIALAGLRALGRAINPHLLRHTFASRLMRVTNARVVQQLLGHKSLTSTQIYTHPNGDDLNEAIKKL